MRELILSIQWQPLHIKLQIHCIILREISTFILFVIRKESSFVLYNNASGIVIRYVPNHMILVCVNEYLLRFNAADFFPI